MVAVRKADGESQGEYKQKRMAIRFTGFVWTKTQRKFHKQATGIVHEGYFREVDGLGHFLDPMQNDVGHIQPRSRKIFRLSTVLSVANEWHSINKKT